MLRLSYSHSKGADSCCSHKCIHTRTHHKGSPRDHQCPLRDGPGGGHHPREGLQGLRSQLRLPQGESQAHTRAGTCGGLVDTNTAVGMCYKAIPPCNVIAMGTICLISGSSHPSCSLVRIRRPGTTLTGVHLEKSPGGGKHVGRHFGGGGVYSEQNSILKG